MSQPNGKPSSENGVTPPSQCIHRAEPVFSSSYNARDLSLISSQPSTNISPTVNQTASALFSHGSVGPLLGPISAPIRPENLQIFGYHVPPINNAFAPSPPLIIHQLPPPLINHQLPPPAINNAASPPPLIIHQLPPQNQGGGSGSISYPNENDSARLLLPLKRSPEYAFESGESSNTSVQRRRVTPPELNTNVYSTVGVGVQGGVIANPPQAFMTPNNVSSTTLSGTPPNTHPFIHSIFKRIPLAPNVHSTVGVGVQGGVTTNPPQAFMTPNNVSSTTLLGTPLNTDQFIHSIFMSTPLTPNVYSNVGAGVQDGVIANPPQAFITPNNVSSSTSLLGTPLDEYIPPMFMANPLASTHFGGGSHQLLMMRQYFHVNSPQSNNNLGAGSMIPSPQPRNNPVGVPQQYYAPNNAVQPIVVSSRRQLARIQAYEHHASTMGRNSHATAISFGHSPPPQYNVYPNSNVSLSAEHTRLISLRDELIRAQNGLRRGTIQIEDMGALDRSIMTTSMRPQNIPSLPFDEMIEAVEDQIENVEMGLIDGEILTHIGREFVQTISPGTPQNDICCICQDDYATGQEVGRLDCGHKFHLDCIRGWLVRKNTCPICKQIALNVEEEEEDDDDDDG